MTEIAPLAIVALLVGFSVLRAVLPRRVRVRRRTEGAFELQRPLGRRLLEIGGLGFWAVLLVVFFVASWWSEFTLGVLVGGVGVVVLLWRAIDRLGRSDVVINRLQNEIREGGRRVGRASDVRAVLLVPVRREPLALIFAEPGEPARRWAIPGGDPATAEAVGRELADYLGVPLESAV